LRAEPEIHPTTPPPPLMVSDLITTMLKKSPEERIGIEEIAQHRELAKLKEEMRATRRKVEALAPPAVNAAVSPAPPQAAASALKSSNSPPSPEVAPPAETCASGQITATRPAELCASDESLSAPRATEAGKAVSPVAGETENQHIWQ
jgi:hypothetical protein